MYDINQAKQIIETAAGRTYSKVRIRQLLGAATTYKREGRGLRGYYDRKLVDDIAKSMSTTRISLAAPAPYKTVDGVAYYDIEAALLLLAQLTGRNVPYCRSSAYHLLPEPDMRGSRNRLLYAEYTVYEAAKVLQGKQDSKS